MKRTTLYFVRIVSSLALMLVAYIFPVCEGFPQVPEVNGGTKIEKSFYIDAFNTRDKENYGVYRNQIIEIFNKPLFDFYGKDVKPEEESNDLIFSIAASPGEFEPLTFFVRSTKFSIDDIRIRVDNLIDQNGDLFTSDNVDVRCVKIWPQAGQWRFVEKIDVLVPELLLYNCCEDLETEGSGNAHILPKPSKHLKVEIDKDTAQQFWVTVHVPDDVKPSIYKGQLNVIVNEVIAAHVPFELFVLPIDLLEPSQDYLIYYKPYPTTPMAIIEKQLIDMRDHGVMGSRVPGFKEKEFFQFLKFAKKYDFKKLIFSFRQCVEKKEIIQDVGFPLICYGIDEPNRLKTNSYKKSLRHHIALSNEIHAIGGNVITAIQTTTAEMLRDPQSTAYDLIDPRTEGEAQTKKTFRAQKIVHETLDFPVYWIEGLFYENRHSSKSLVNFIAYTNTPQKSLRDKAEKEYYYWQMWKDLPHMNRHLSGYFLWQSGLNGIMPYVYQGRYKSNAYNDRENGRYRQQMVAYPSSDGPIPTLKWEEFREGYDDVRYLTTLFHLIEEYEKVDRKGASIAAKEVQVDLMKYNHPISFKEMKSSDYQQTRRTIIAKILELKKVLLSN